MFKDNNEMSSASLLSSRLSSVCLSVCLVIYTHIYISVSLGVEIRPVAGRESRRSQCVAWDTGALSLGALTSQVLV